MAEGMFGLDPAMVQELINKERGQQANQFVEGLGQTGLGASLFNPIARGAYGLLQQTKDTLNPDPRIQKAQAMEQIKTIASQKAQAGSPEFYQVIIEEAQRLNVPEVAEKAQAKLMEIEKSRQESFSKGLSNQKTALDIQKTAMEMGQGRKSEKYDPISNSLFSKNYYELTPDQQQKVLDAEEASKVKVSKAGASSTVIKEGGTDITKFRKDLRGDDTVKSAVEIQNAAGRAFSLVDKALSNPAAGKAVSRELAKMFNQGTLSNVDVAAFSNLGDIGERVKNMFLNFTQGQVFTEKQLKEAVAVLDAVQRKAIEDEYNVTKDYVSDYGDDPNYNRVLEQVSIKGRKIGFDPSAPKEKSGKPVKRKTASGVEYTVEE